MLPLDLIHLISEYVPQYCLLDWITENMINKKTLEKTINLLNLTESYRMINIQSYMDIIKNTTNNLIMIYGSHAYIQDEIHRYVNMINWQKLYRYQDVYDLIEYATTVYHFVLARMGDKDFTQLRQMFMQLDRIGMALDNLDTNGYIKEFLIDECNNKDIRIILNKRHDMLDFLKNNKQLIIVDAFSTNPGIVELKVDKDLDQILSRLI